MPTIIFEDDFTIPRDTESYKKGQVVNKTQASFNFFKNLGAPVRLATADEIKGVTTAVTKAKAAKSEKPGIDKTPGSEPPVKKKPGPSSQAAPVSQKPTATSLSDLEFRPSGSTAPTK